MKAKEEYQALMQYPGLRATIPKLVEGPPFLSLRKTGRIGLRNLNAW